MGIKVEFNPDLALRRFGTQNRKIEGCIPEKIEKGNIYNFLKEGLRNYWLEGEVPLLITEGNSKLSQPIASVIIIESTHFKKDNKLWTKRKYKVEEIFDISNNKINFEGLNRVK